MRRLVFVFLLGLVLTISVYPAAIIYPSNTLPDDNDTRLIAYIIGQVQKNLLDHRPLFYGTFFAPYNNTLTYSDPFITTAILTLPFRYLTDNPITIFNLAFLFNSTFTFIAAFYFFKSALHPPGEIALHLLSRRALLATSVFFLSGYHLAYLPHLQVFSLWAAFAALYFFLRGHYRLFGLFIFLQAIDSPFPVFLIFFASIIFLWQKKFSLKKITLSIAPFLFLVLIIYLPYLEMAATFPEAARPIRDAAHFSLGIEEIFTKYHSWTVILLIISLCIKPSKKQTSDFLLLVFGLLLSLGPVLKLHGFSLKVLGLPIPLPYAFFYYVFPGFQSLRTPSRFILLALIGAATIIAKKINPKTAIILLITSFLLLEASLPRTSYFVNPTPPPIYEQVRNLPGDAVILELPILLWNMPDHEIESLRSLYSLYHGHRRLGGFSGFAPLAWISLVQQINASSLNERNVSRLKALGITHILENNQLKPLQSTYGR